MPQLIHVISSDPRLVARLTELLQAEGREIAHAGTGRSTPADARRPDLVVVDTELADVDASTLVRRLGALEPRPALLVVAERASAEAAVAALRAGADDVLFRPLDPLGAPARVDALLARRLLEAERERTTTLEFRTQELESFIYIVTHDMKTPVVNLQGLVGLVEQDHGGELSEQVREYLGRVRKNAERLEELLRDLLEYPRRLRLVGPLEPTPIGPVVAAAVDGLAELARAKGVAVQVATDLPTVPADRKRLQQVFHNLVENGVKHAAGHPGARIEVGWSRTTDGPRFHVRDNGPGIAADQLDSVFKLFHRVPGTPAEGTGIGLAVARQLVEAHGGAIWVESQPGQGASFYFTLGR